MAISRDQQIENLSRVGSGETIERFIPGLWLLAAALGALGWYLDNAMFYPFAGFFAFVALVSKGTTRQLRLAVTGELEGRRVRGMLEILIEPGSDSPTYTAIAPGRSDSKWKFTFIPQGWEPKTGQHFVELVYLPNFDWPVLVLAAEGILYPRDEPKPKPPA